MYLQVNNASFLPEGLESVDKSVFFRVNGRWHNSFMDTILPLVREPTIWIPFYIFLILLVTINFKIRGWLWVIAILILAGISDFTSSTLIKHAFTRLRPCRDPQIADTVRFIVSYCPLSSSFVSSHAVNHFAISTFIFVTFKRALSRKWAFIFLWAALISYAQVYVGVHFPLDVTAGAAVGVSLGFAGASLFNRYFPLPVSR